MASISYWFLSPTVILALLGKLKGFDRTRPTPAFDWKSATVDVVIPARNEEAVIALCLASLFEQDFPIRKITVFNDGSSDKTAQVVRRFTELNERRVDLVAREKSAGKTPTLREHCRASDADALVILDADTVLADRHYISRLIEELFKNAGVASACGEVMPLTRRRRRLIVRANPRLQAMAVELGIDLAPRQGRLHALLEFITIIYRSALYVFLQRFLYDGHLKMFGSRLSPTGCAVAYRTQRLRECFEYAQPRMGDNLSNSEDIFIGHFFTWKGYRNVQVTGVRCESLEPTVVRLPRQLFFWSSSFLQAQYYFKELPLSSLKQLKNAVAGLFGRSHGKPGSKTGDRRRIREQYRWPWGEEHTRRYGRRMGLVHLCSVFEKVSYPLVMLYLAIFHPQAALFTIGLEALLCTAGVFTVAEPGTRWKFAGMMLAATPIRIASLGVDLLAVLKYVLDLATGNRKWRK